MNQKTCTWRVLQSISKLTETKKLYTALPKRIQFSICRWTLEIQLIETIITNANFSMT